MKNIDLLTIGDCSIDLFMKVDKDFVSTENEDGHLEICFYHGSKVPVESFETSIAGNACNVAVACSKLGLKCEIYTELGEDPNADRIISELSNFNINTDFCIKNPGTPTNVHAIIVHQGERTIFSYHEKRNYKLYPWPPPKWILYSSLAKGFDSFQAKLVEYIKKENIGVAFNPGTQQLREGLTALKNMLAVTHVLFVNKEEAQMLLNNKTEDDIATLHKKLQGLGPRLTVITLGDQGSTAFDGKTLEIQPAYDLDKPILDKTGAGDAYASAFIAALFYKKPLKEAMLWGTINAAHVIREIGAIRGFKTKEELETLI